MTKALQPMKTEELVKIKTFGDETAQKIAIFPINGDSHLEELARSWEPLASEVKGAKFVFAYMNSKDKAGIRSAAQELASRALGDESKTVHLVTFSPDAENVDDCCLTEDSLLKVTANVVRNTLVGKACNPYTADRNVDSLISREEKPTETRAIVQWSRLLQSMQIH